MQARRLGFIESALAINDAYRPMNAVAVLTLRGPFAADALSASLDYLQVRHPALRAAIGGRHRRTLEYRPTRSVPLDVVPRADADAWQEVVERALVTRIPAAGPLAMATMVGSGDEAAWELVVAVNHVVVDAASLANLLHELLSVYAATLEGRPLPFTNALDPPAAVDTLFPAGWRGARLRARRTALLLRSLPAEAGYRRAMRRNEVFPIRHETSPQIHPMELGAGITSRLSRRARDHRLTVHSVLHGAMLSALHRECYGSRPLRLRTFAFADLRPYVAGGFPPEPMAPYIAMTWHDVKLGPESALWEVAAAVQEKVAASLRHGGRYVASAATAPLMRMTVGVKRFRMGNTALTYTDRSGVATAYGDVAVHGLHGFLSNMGLGPEFSMRTGIFDGRLVLDMVTLDADMSSGEGRRLGERVRSILEEAAGADG